MYEKYKKLRMSKETFEFNECEECFLFYNCHGSNIRKNNVKYCPEIDEDRWKKPHLFKEEKEINNKILEMNGYNIPNDEKYGE